MQGFESVEHELEQKRLQLEQELVGLRGRASEIEVDLERVHEALGALLGTKKKTKARGRSRKTVPSVQDLQQHIAHVREESPFADAGLLERTVRALVQQSGGSLSGFKTTFAEALLTSPGTGHDEPRPALPSQGHAHGVPFGHEREHEQEHEHGDEGHHSGHHSGHPSDHHSS